MDFTDLPIGRTLYPMSIFGAIVGLAVGMGYSPANKNHTWYFMAGGAVLFFWVGWRIIVWKVQQSQYVHEMRSEVEYVPDTDTSRYLDLQIWTDSRTSHWVRLGVTDEEWHKMAVSVHGAKLFSTDTVDRKIYSKVKERFLQIGLVETGGKGGGLVLTRDGLNFFKYLALLPYPYEDEPDLVKLLDESPRTN